MMEAFLAIIVFWILLSIYLLPFYVAVIRRKNMVSIFITNLFFGWTIVGWVIALIWAFKD